MLFNSYPFAFLFLPIALVVFYSLGRWRTALAKISLCVLSLAFYAYWNVKQLPILLFSIVFNYAIGLFICRFHKAERLGTVRALLLFGVFVDVSLLVWFKYINFIVDNLDYVGGLHIQIARIALPLAISFFTFQKIAYLVDASRGETKPISFLDFSLFASFFPQLIAGPIVHFKQIVPQMHRRRFGRLIARNLLVGLVIVSIGLFKKTVIADTIATYVTPLYRSPDVAFHHSLYQGWMAAVGFTFQLYFDFSGYSDIAIGLARMFGVRLPLNFHSPLRAANIIEYWRRWHMTLNRFIVAYIFQPLSLPANRWAAERGLSGASAFAAGVGLPIVITFLIVGAWHGAGWTYVIFGLMHAVYMCANEAWREYQKRRRRALKRKGVVMKDPGAPALALSHAATLLAVLLANVMFNSATPVQAAEIWRSMIGLGAQDGAPLRGFDPGLNAMAVACGLIVFLMPNTQQIMSRFDPAYDWRDWRRVGRPPISWTWRPTAAGFAFCGVALAMGLLFIERGPAVFMYFNF